MENRSKNITKEKILTGDKAQLIDILRLGSQKSQEESNQVLDKVKCAFGLNLFN